MIFEVSVRAEAKLQLKVSRAHQDFSSASHPTLAERAERHLAFFFFLFFFWPVRGNDLPKLQPAPRRYYDSGGRRDTAGVNARGEEQQPKGLTLGMTTFTLGKKKMIMEDHFGS